jgi:hypothetical protein
VTADPAVGLVDESLTALAETDRGAAGTGSLRITVAEAVLLEISGSGVDVSMISARST